LTWRSSRSRDPKFPNRIVSNVAAGTRRRRAQPGRITFARARIDAVARAQEAGDLPAHFPPGFLLGLVLHLAAGWVSVSPEFEAAIDVPDLEERARPAPATSA
jgi:hypothetical protein